MEKCLIAGAGTNSVVLGCSRLLGSAGSQQINYPHLLRSEGMGGSLPESPSNLFLVFGELVPVPVMLHRQAGKSQQPQLAVWMLAGGELTAQESVLGTADMFKWRASSQTKMLVSKAWKLHRVIPAPCTSPLGSREMQGLPKWWAAQGRERGRIKVLPHLAAWEEQGSPSLEGCPWPGASRRSLALVQPCRSLAGAARARGDTGHPLLPGSSAPGLAPPPGVLALAGGSGSSLPDMRMNVFISTQSARTCVF